MKRTDLDVEKIIGLYNKRSTARSISESFNCDVSCILRILRENNIIISKKYRKQRNSTNICENELKELYINKRLKASQIGQIYNCSKVTVVKYLRMYNLGPLGAKELTHISGKKYCGVCKELLTIDSFGISCGTADGYKYICNKCSSKKYKNNRQLYRNAGRKRRDLKKKMDYKYNSSIEKITRMVFNNSCFNCKSKNNLCIDHHYPLSKGNGLAIDNAVLLCKSCNSKKFIKSPKEFYNKKQIREIDRLLKSAKEVLNEKNNIGNFST